MIKKIAIEWQPKPLFLHSLSENLLNWISYPKSFMQRLLNYGVADAQIEVLFQGFTFPEENDRQKLQLPPKKYIFLRDVIIASPEVKWMFARTVIPLHSLSGQNTILKFLKTKTLGSFLFKDPKLKRSAFEFAECNFPVLNSKICFARRSTFNYHNKSLLLTEVFSPEIAKLC